MKTRHFEYRLTLDFSKEVNADTDILSDRIKGAVETLVKSFFRAENPTVRIVRQEREAGSEMVL